MSKTLIAVIVGQLVIISAISLVSLAGSETDTPEVLVAEAKKTYRELQYVPMTSISALTGQRVTTSIWDRFRGHLRG